MNKSPRAYVFEALDLLPEALIPFVEKHLQSAFDKQWRGKLREIGIKSKANGTISWDVPKLLRTMSVNELWKPVFSKVLSTTERSYAFALINVRNNHAHNEPFDCDEAKHALDTMRFLLKAVGANDQAKRIADARARLRAECDEHARNEKRREQAALKPNSNDKLKDVLAYVLGGHADDWPKGLDNTRLNNVVYLADWHHAQKYGKTITGIKWAFSQFPNSMYVREIENTAEADKHTFSVKSKERAGKRAANYFSLQDKSFQPQLGAEEVETLDSIIGETAHLSQEEFTARVNETPPMKFFEKGKSIDLVKKAKEQQRS